MSSIISTKDELMRQERLVLTDPVIHHFNKQLEYLHNFQFPCWMILPDGSAQQIGGNKEIDFEIDRVRKEKDDYIKSKYENLL